MYSQYLAHQARGFYTINADWTEGWFGWVSAAARFQSSRHKLKQHCASEQLATCCSEDSHPFLWNSLQFLKCQSNKRWTPSATWACQEWGTIKTVQWFCIVIPEYTQIWILPLPMLPIAYDKSLSVSFSFLTYKQSCHGRLLWGSKEIIKPLL